MTKFTFKRDVTWGFGGAARSGTVMAENEAGWAAYAGKVGNAIWFATMALSDVITHLNAGGSAMATHFANKFFQTGDVLSDSDRKKILSVLVLTLNGINNQMGIKLGDKEGVDGWSWVRFTKREATLSYHNKIARAKKPGKQKLAGAIHLSAAAAASADLTLIKRTLVHEASHKFAGTDDFCYFKDDHPYAIKDGGSMTNAQALMNADSYAFFSHLPLLSAERAALENVHDPFA